MYVYVYVYSWWLKVKQNKHEKNQLTKQFDVKAPKCNHPKTKNKLTENKTHTYTHIHITFVYKLNMANDKTISVRTKA